MQWEWLFDSSYPVCLSLLQQGGTALYFACQSGHADIMNLLLEKGANINKVQHQLIYYDIKLDHIPNSYIVLMVHVVKGHQYTYIHCMINAGASIAEMASKIDSRLRVSMLQSQEMNLTAQYSF